MSYASDNEFRNGLSNTVFPRACKSTPMNDSKDPNFPMFELYLATAEKVSDRRAQAHSWMLSVAFLVFTATALS